MWELFDILSLLPGPRRKGDDRQDGGMRAASAVVFGIIALAAAVTGIAHLLQS